MKTRIRMLTLAMTMLIVLASACRTSPVSTMKKSLRVLVFSLAASEESSWHKGAAMFADLIKLRTNGRLAVSLFPRASLASGDPVKELEMLQESKIDFSYTASTVYSHLDPRFSVMVLPWMFTSYDDVDMMLTGAMGQELLTGCDRLGIVGLALGEDGFEQVTNSKREIKTPADVRGLKIGLRSANVDPSVFSSLGATTRWLNSSEAYSAMQNGIVDGQKSPIDQVVSNRLYEVQKYMTVWNYSYSPIILGVNKAVWASFDADMQEIIRQAAEEASAFQVQESRKVVDVQLQLLRQKGMLITVLSPDQIKPFRDLVSPVYAEYEPIIGKEVKAKFVAGDR